MVRPDGAGQVLQHAASRRLVAARAEYESALSPWYDEVLHEVSDRAHSKESLGKVDIGARLFWKRLRADTSWTRA